MYSNVTINDSFLCFRCVPPVPPVFCSCCQFLVNPLETEDEKTEKQKNLIKQKWFYVFGKPSSYIDLYKNLKGKKLRNERILKLTNLTKKQNPNLQTESECVSTCVCVCATIISLEEEEVLLLDEKQT